MRKTIKILSCITVIGVMLSSWVHAQDFTTGALIDRSTRLTFSGPVSLPHVSLPAGTYLFRFVDVNRSRIVQVLSSDGKVSYGMFDTIPIARSLAAAESGDLVTFKEAAAAAPRVIDAWFYAYTEGCEIIY